jgi:hypothetical protein
VDWHSRNGFKDGHHFQQSHLPLRRRIMLTAGGPSGSASAREIAEMRGGGPVHVEFIPGTHYPLRNMSNDYLIDRELQKSVSFTGIKGIGEQDFSVQERMGRTRARACLPGRVSLEVPVLQVVIPLPGSHA